MAEMLSRDLAARGLMIFSGMARGVDTAAHKGALDAGGKTRAVWGTGIDVIYPKENKKLAEQIVLPAAPSSASSRWARFLRRRTFPFATAYSAG